MRQTKKSNSENKNICVISDAKDFKIRTKSDILIENVFEEFYSNIVLLNLNDKQTNEVLNISSSLVKGFSSALCESFVTSLESDPTQLVHQLSEELCEIISQRNSKSKRIKGQKNNDLFVPAGPKVVGKKWKCKLDAKYIPLCIDL